MDSREEKIIRKIKSLKKMPGNFEKSEDEIRRLAENSVDKQTLKSDEGYKFKDVLKRKEDIDLAEELLMKYLNDFQIETQADRNTLLQLIKLEVFDRRLGEKIDTMMESDKNSVSSLMKSLHDNLDQIRKLKEMLGLNNKGNDSGANYIQLLLKRARIWSETLNKGDRTFFCQHCSKPNLLTFKIDQYDPIKHPFFQGRYITNPHLIELCLTGKITEEDVGKVLGTASQDYVEWLVKTFFTREHLDRIKQKMTIHYKKKFLTEENTEDAKTTQ